VPLATAQSIPAAPAPNDPCRQNAPRAIGIGAGQIENDFATIAPQSHFCFVDDNARQPGAHTAAALKPADVPIRRDPRFLHRLFRFAIAQ